MSDHSSPLDLAAIKTAIRRELSRFEDGLGINTALLIPALRDLLAAVERLEHRLEIDRAYDFHGKEIVIPPDQRAKFPDGITCRDETIRLQEEAVERLEGQLAAIKEDGRVESQRRQIAEAKIVAYKEGSIDDASEQKAKDYLNLQAKLAEAERQRDALDRIASTPCATCRLNIEARERAENMVERIREADKLLQADHVAAEVEQAIAAYDKAEKLEG